MLMIWLLKGKGLQPWGLRHGGSILENQNSSKDQDRGVVKNWWSSFTAINNYLPSLDGGWKDWIFSNIEAKRWTKVTVVFSFLLRCWELWLLRNAVIFNSNPKPGNVRAQCLVGASEFFAISLVIKVVYPPPAVMVKWHPPRLGWTCFEIEVDSTAIISLVTNDAITNNLLGILKAKLGSSHGSILNTDLVAVFVEPPEAVVSFL
ncbi:hypothetical protein PVK06_004933 [Gossypium arboreum]|uniref:Uncharacterized protein n=1 Tax=Gossypium arboreum TaxID=29729 RepID=A0ABR0QTB4_GOSAR|nr:hypothetical protein PVK06_004933 [Gossypium arboreum]